MAGVWTSMDDVTFTYDIRSLALREFNDHFKLSFPCFVMVTQGYCGENELETLGSGQVLRLHSVLKRKRVVAVDPQQRTLSIPINYPLRFKVQGKGTKQAGTLEEIVTRTTLPISVQIADKRNVSFTLNHAQKNEKSLGLLNIKDIYEETYFLATAIANGHPNEQPVIVPLYLKDVHISMVTGIQGKGNAYWNKYQSFMKSVFQSVSIPVDSGLREIALYSPQSVNSTDNIYDCIEPASYIYANWDGIADGSYVTLAKPKPPKPPKPMSMPADVHHEGPPPVLPRRNSSSVVVADADSSDRRANAYVNDIQRAAVGPFKHIAQAAADVVSAKAGQGRLFSRGNDQNGNGSPGQSVHPIEEPSKGKDKSINTYTIDELAQVLKDLKLNKYIETFKKQGVDGELAAELDESILRDEFKFSKFDSLKFMKFVNTGHIPR